MNEWMVPCQNDHLQHPILCVNHSLILLIFSCASVTMMVLILNGHLFQTGKDSSEIIAPWKSFKTRKRSTVLQEDFFGGRD